VAVPELALSAWGCWDDQIDDITLYNLQVAYMRRSKWLARLQAVEIVNALGEALGGAKSRAPRAQHVELDAFMAQAGITWS